MKHLNYFTLEKLAKRLELIEPLAHAEKYPISPFRLTYLTEDESLPNAPEPIHKEWSEIRPQSYWGKWKTNFLLKSEFSIPENLKENSNIFFYLPLGKSGDIFTHPESLVYIDDMPIASADRYHHEIRIPKNFCDGKSHCISLRGWTGYSNWPPDPNDGRQLMMGECSVVRIHQATRDFTILARLILDVQKTLCEKDPAGYNLLNILQAAFLKVDTMHIEDRKKFYESVTDALKILEKGISSAAEKPKNIRILAAGHAHMDIAYLWRIRQIRLKNARTYHNVLNMMEEFPEYRFSHSQPQLYRYTEEDYPKLFEKIKERIDEGRWEIMGGMWVEADTNIPGPESLVRQLLLGRKYFAEKFGEKETPVLWLPDTFGFSWCLPQLMKQAGLKWFLTNKISWNQYNSMPAQITQWQGMDGTRILSYFMTVPRKVQYLPYPTTYKAEMTPEEINGAWSNFKQKGDHDELLMLYGYGDGGGGPTREMIQKARRLNNMPGMPQIKTGTVREFFDGLEQVNNLPVWNDELYLEGHRGVLTGNSRIKRANRKAEILLHNTEFLCTLATIKTGKDYPWNLLKKAWELLCLNQFHDIITGTSVQEVFEDAHADFQTIREIGTTLSDHSIKELIKTFSRNECFAVINATSFEASPILFTQTPSILERATSQKLPMQICENGALIHFHHLPAYSLSIPNSFSHETTSANSLFVRESENKLLIMGNERIEYRFNQKGRLISIYDKEAEREVLLSGKDGNRLVIYEDRPINWDAWDIDIFYDETFDFPKLASPPEIIESGPLRAGIRFCYRYGKKSIIEQSVFLTQNSKQIDFVTLAEWHERHRLLKVEFDVDILNPMATYDIQWGNIQRPTHQNTSWDFAKFEVPAQKWADLSEENYGVALLNDCKYGYRISEQTMSLSLIKSAIMPDESADQGSHVFTYALLPHIGNQKSEIAKCAALLNNPCELISLSGNTGTESEYRLVSCKNSNVIIETIKHAEDGNGFIVRLHENERHRKRITLQFGIPLSKVSRCNLLEEEQETLTCKNPVQLNLEIRPYEIISLRCIPIQTT